MPLPSRLTSLYRLTLRAASASVKHHAGATRNLRALYRPVFEDAAKVAKDLVWSTERSEELEGKERWFVEWEKRSELLLIQ